MYIHDSMASNKTILPSSSIITCDIARVYISTGLTSHALQAVVAIINIVIAFFGTLANGLVILAYYRNSRLRNIQNTIFLLLAFTDIVVTSVVEPLYVTVIFDSFLDKRRCVIYDVCSVLSTLFVELSLAASVILSLQSYITLAYPYHYHSIITKSRLTKTIVVSVLLVSSLAFSNLWNKHFVIYGSLGILVGGMTTVVFIWCWTYRLIARHRKAIQTTQTPSTSQNTSRRKILRSTITAFTIVASLLTCYFFAAFLLFSENILNPIEIPYTFRAQWSIAMTSVYLNSLLNPCLVFWRSSSFRETVENIFIC